VIPFTKEDFRGYCRRAAEELALVSAGFTGARSLLGLETDGVTTLTDLGSELASTAVIVLFLVGLVARCAGGLSHRTGSGTGTKRAD